ncbi:terpenoid cyclases/protein prenyltransferase alpha-alpha toroid [Paraphysoderma sedebokerense]|nr:terpenoid cyclases/protein prenyltransferase alpha-alpha toroid [Paraphysoderma sedebokerense]KAI9138318.1 terpenoid cyclases/protein prenyltransferase alpha-alpha toroid [Paraphysoderma sedebokerense]
MIYWMVHSLDMMGYGFTSDMKQRIISTLQNHIHPCGGFRGGSAQLPHLAPTFAGVSTLAILKEPSGFEMIDREKFREFLLSVKTEDGSFRMCHDGEIDVRGTYCALVTASLLNILDEELSRGAAEFALRCQTYEGGIAGYPYTEAHGGYTFCGLAALEILGRVGDLNFESLMQWLASRQLTLEGGFSGRTNKLVDGCYSFWVGGCFGIVEAELTRRGEKWGGGYLFDREALQEYILICCQAKKGLRDKPGKSPDYYHTCYCLSGLSVAQHQLEFIQSPSIGRSPTLQPNTKTVGYDGHYKVTESKELIIGKRKKNTLKPIHPVYNVSLESVDWVKGLCITKGETIRSLC